MSACRTVLSGVRTLASTAVYATLIVTFGFQVTRARVVYIGEDTFCPECGRLMPDSGSHRERNVH
jgi:hypothetical protein